MTIRYLAQEGEQIATLARRFGLSRQTIYNQLARATTAPAPRPRRPSALDAFRDYLGARLASFDLPAPVLLRELRTRGYTGGLTILRDAMRPLKAEQIRRVTERFETLPGRQAQADWGECGTIVEPIRDTLAPKTARLLKRLQRIEELPPADQRAVLKLVDAMLDTRRRSTPTRAKRKRAESRRH